MKTKSILTACLLAFTATGCLFAQGGIVRKVMMSLQDGERIVTNESCIELSYSANQLYLVTQQGKNTYIYEGGQRKGPFKSLDQIKAKGCENSSSQLCAAYDPDERDNQAEFISYTDAGEMSIKFKGKSYGPYKMVNAMHVPMDKSWFVALVVNSDMKCSIVSSDLPIQPIEGNTSFLQVSNVGKNYLTAVKDDDVMNAELMKMDFSKMTQDQMLKIMQEQAEKKKNAGPPKAYVYTNGGKKFGPFPAESIRENNPAFCKTGGGNWYMTIDNALYINGTKVKEFSYDNVSASTCNIWLSADGSRYAIIAYTKILFSDGTSYPAPIKLETENKEGKTLMKWISLENEKDLVSYIKEL